MGRYSGRISGQGRRKLAAGMDKLLGLDLAAAFPDPVDREKVLAAIKVIKAKTTKNERIACFKAIGVTLGASLAKAVQKAILAVAVVLVVGAGMAQAQVKALDLSNPLADPRAGIAWDAQGVSLGVAFVPVIYWVGESSGLEYATLNWGMSDVLSNGKKAMLVSIGPRIDNVFSWLAGGT